MDLSYKELSEKAGISPSFAAQLLNGTRSASLNVALDIYDRTGLQFGILKGLSEQSIADLRKQAA